MIENTTYIDNATHREVLQIRKGYENDKDIFIKRMKRIISTILEGEAFKDCAPKKIRDFLDFNYPDDHDKYMELRKKFATSMNDIDYLKDNYINFTIYMPDLEYYNKWMKQAIEKKSNEEKYKLAKDFMVNLDSCIEKNKETVRNLPTGKGGKQ